jgi:hypothetical protein
MIDPGKQVSEIGQYGPIHREINLVKKAVMALRPMPSRAGVAMIHSALGTARYGIPGAGRRGKGKGAAKQLPCRWA